MKENAKKVLDKFVTLVIEDVTLAFVSKTQVSDGGIEYNTRQTFRLSPRYAQIMGDHHKKYGLVDTMRRYKEDIASQPFYRAYMKEGDVEWTHWFTIYINNGDSFSFHWRKGNRSFTMQSKPKTAVGNAVLDILGREPSEELFGYLRSKDTSIPPGE